MNETESDLVPLLAKAGILIFEYDADGYLLRASGSALGYGDPELEVRAGLVTPESVRRAVGGAAFTERVEVGSRCIAVRHEPVCDASGRALRVLATACDVTRFERAAHEALTLIAPLPLAS